MFVRRVALLAAVAGLAACGGAGDASHAPPSMRVVLQDDFDSLDTIDLTGQGSSGKTWFTDLPFGWASAPSSVFSVADGVLTISPTQSRQNVQLASGSARSGAGRGFRYGYFEARLAFDPASSPRSDGFPAFWGVSWSQARGAGRNRTQEIDFFEALPPEGKRGREWGDRLAGTVHDILLGPETDRANYGDNVTVRRGVDWTAFHTYGCHWEKGRLRWYLDGELLHTQTYSATATPSPNSSQLAVGAFGPLDTDTAGQVVLLGTGARYPLRVDWVRVYQ